MSAGRAGRERGWRAAFAMYAALIFVLTHWPALAIPAGAVPRPDVLAHLGAFSIWMFLLVRAGFFGAWTASRNVLVSAVVGVAYLCFDEGSQAIPALRRHARWDDLAANILGASLGLAAAMLLGAIEREGAGASR